MSDLLPKANHSSHSFLLLAFSIVKCKEYYLFSPDHGMVLRIQSQKVGEDSLSIGKHLSKCRDLDSIEIILRNQCVLELPLKTSWRKQLSSNVF